MKKLLAGVAVALLAGSAAPAIAGPHDHKPGNNTHGLCTAYFSGLKKGWEKNGTPPPFQGLEDAAGDYDGDGDQDRADVYQYCQDVDEKFDR